MLELCCTTHIWMNGLWCCSVLENYVAPHVFEWISCDATVSFLCIFMTEWVFCFRFWCTWAYCRNRVVGSLLKINLKVQWHIQLIILDSDRLGVNLPSLADHPVLGYSHIKVHRWWDNFCLSQSIHDNADAAGMIAVANSHLTISGTWGPCRKLLCLRDLLHVWFLVKQKVHWEKCYGGGLLACLVSCLTGGPLGELVQWSDLISVLYLLGHQLTITSEVEQLVK